jgi:uncharacterized DUF497 family protein
MEFEWDEAKARTNFEKHSVPFEGACRVFFDANRLESEDDRMDYGETRFITLGEVEGVVLYVVYTWRRRRRRLISARKATGRERRNYAAYQA